MKTSQGYIILHQSNCTKNKTINVVLATEVKLSRFQIKNNLDHLKRILIPFHLLADDFSPSSMFSHSDYLLSYQEQTNDEKRIKRYLHHKLHPSPNACLSFLPLRKAFNLFPSSSGTDSRGQGAQEMKPAPVNILVPVGPYLSNIFMMKVSEQQVEVDDI